MANALAGLLAKQKGTPNAPDAAPTPASAESQAVGSDGVSGTPAVQASSSPTQASIGRPANPFAGRKPVEPVVQRPVDSDGSPTAAGSESPAANKPGLSGLKFGVDGAGSPVPSKPAESLPSLAGLSLESLSESSDEGIAPVKPTSFFEDETPAQQPTRELPEGLTTEELGFIGLIDSIYNILHDADFLGSVIKNIIIELKNHPEYTRLIADEDVRQWVRGMRESMGLAKIKKQETKAKRSGGSGAKSKTVDADMLADLDFLGIKS